MGASPGTLGTARAQYHLRQILLFLNMFPINQPEVMIANAAARFDKDGNLTDETTIEPCVNNRNPWVLKRLKEDALREV
jgi:chromate reductase, NAD(P)H dehydrogenase (quinone)